MSLPTWLTLLRIILIPLLLFFMAYEFLLSAFTLYVLLTLTDFFDGYLARKMNATSALGAFLDPIADKLLVAAMLIMMVSNNVIQGVFIVAPLIIILREIWVPALRGYIGYDKDIAAVTQLAKWKTTFQMIALGLLVFPVQLLGIYYLGLACLTLAALLTAITAWDYTRKAYEFLKQ